MAGNRSNLLTSGDFEAIVADCWPPHLWQDVTVLVAVSGGADSVALLRSLLAIRPNQSVGQLIIGHVNHLASEQSDQFEQWVINEATELGIRCTSRRLEKRIEGASNLGQSFEALLRKSRYETLLNMAQECGARYIAIGHHLDDQVETVLFRILRGTGIAGLSGIPKSRQLDQGVTLIRPLLAISRDDIHRYLENLNQGFLQDASNADRRFARNLIRHEVLPMLRTQFNCEVDQAIVRLGQLADETNQFIRCEAVKLAQVAVTIPSDNEFTIECCKLETVSEFLIRTTLMFLWDKMGWPRQPMTYDKWQQLADMIGSKSQPSKGSLGRNQFPGGIAVEKSENIVRVFRSSSASDE